MDYDSLYRAIYEFTTTIQGELPLLVGDVVKFENAVDDDWWYGYKVNAEGAPSGIFPSAFVAKCDLSLPLKQCKSIWIASEDFLGLQDGDLNLLRGDVIIDVRQVDANWLEGRSGLNFIKRGIFPVNFACQLPPPLTQRKPIFSLDNEAQEISSLRYGQAGKSPDIRARVICDLEAKLPGEISLFCGEIVYIEDYVDETFCSGRTEDGSRCGIFPKRFVEICDSKTQVEYKKLDSTLKNAPTTSFIDVNSSTINTFGSRPSEGLSASHQEANGNKNYENNHLSGHVDSYGYSKYEFIPQYKEELGFKANQRMKLIKHVDHEWILGEIDGKKGIFPTSYVDIKIDCPWMNAKNNGSKGPEASSLNNALLVTYRAMYDFDGMVGGDLETAMGDLIQMLNKIDDCWIEAKNLRTQKIGMIPLSFLKQNDSDEICPRESKNVSLRPSSWNCDSICDEAASSKHNSLKHRVSIPDATLQVQNELRIKHNQDIEKKKLDLRSQRTHIFDEIIHSENDYINDLTLCIDVFRELARDLDVSALLSGFSEIIALSRKLIQGLEEEYEKDFVYQEIGNAFLVLQDGFKDVYADFCQTHESTQKLLGEYEKDAKTQPVLLQVLSAIQSRTVCLDLSTMLSRPVQRVLKYPLFISELLKCTEDNSSDKVKLLMALKVMTEVAQCINESKRRKDLVMKYRKEEESNLSSRLSKINIHTFRKKSNRFSMRLTTSIGLTQTIKDEQFDGLEKQFRSLEKASRVLLKDLQSYCTQALGYYSAQLSIAEDLVCLMDSNSSKSIHLCDTLSEVLSNDLQDFFDLVNLKTRDPIHMIQQTFQGPTNLMTKRYDKLLDYESSLSKQIKEKNKTDGADESKLRSLNEDVRKCKAEYEALNVQLISDLPHFLSSANEILSMAIKAFIGAQRTFVYNVSKRLAVLNGLTSSTSNIIGDVKRPTASSTAPSSSLVFNKQSVISRKSSGSTISSGDDAKHVDGTLQSSVAASSRQTNDLKRSLVAKYQIDKIFKVSKVNKPTKEMDLSLNVDDIVGVIVNKDPTGNSQRWFVDDGVNKGFVLGANLQPYSPTPASLKVQESDSQITPASIDDAETPCYGSCLRPTRLAPPVPKPQYQSVPDDRVNFLPQRPHRTENRHPASQQQQAPQMEYFVASFNYRPISSNEVALETGQLVAVHAKHDLQMNTEWWLVENEQGDIGYVPANYLAPV